MGSQDLTEGALHRCGVVAQVRIVHGLVAMQLQRSRHAVGVRPPHLVIGHRLARFDEFVTGGDHHHSRLAADKHGGTARQRPPLRLRQHRGACLA